jgi:hypothetical protein
MPTKRSPLRKSFPNGPEPWRRLLPRSRKRRRATRVCWLPQPPKPTRRTQLRWFLCDARWVANAPRRWCRGVVSSWRLRGMSNTELEDGARAMLADPWYSFDEDGPGQAEAWAWRAEGSKKCRHYDLAAMERRASELARERQAQRRPLRQPPPHALDRPGRPSLPPTRSRESRQRRRGASPKLASRDDPDEPPSSSPLGRQSAADSGVGAGP